MFDGRFRSGVDRTVKPVGQALERTGLSPHHLTLLGLAMAVPAAWAIAAGRLGLGLVLLIASAVPDLLDGALAKAAGRATVQGAFFDSVCDRITDTLILGGIAWYLQSRDGGHAFMLPLAVLGVSLLISYERAKAEALGLSAKGGLMERAERIVMLCAGLAFSFLLVPLLWVMLVLTSFTAVQRFVRVWRQAGAASEHTSRAGAASERTSTAGAASERTSTAGAASERTSTAGEAPRRPSRTDERVAARSGGGDDPMALAVRWRAWREANGWTPRPSRYAQGSTRAAARWHERRQRRLARRDDEAREPIFGRRAGPRRP